MEDQLVRLEHIRRWPGDGIDQHRQSVASGECPHCETAHPCEVQQRLTDVLGGWPVETRYADMNDELKAFYLSLPFSKQKLAADKLANLEAAANHLFDVCEEEEQRSLLSRAKAADAVKFGRRSFLSWTTAANSTEYELSPGGLRFDENGYFSSAAVSHHGINMILSRLLQHNEASYENIRLLFGSELHVMGALLGLEELLETTAIEGSAFHLKQNQMFDESKIKPLLTCAHCSKSGIEDSIQRCGGCRREVFCSKACLKAEWPLHVLDCNRVTGKPVTQAMIDKAKGIMVQRLFVKAEEQRQSRLSNVEKMLESVQGDENATSFSTQRLFDCNGVPRRKDLSVYFLEALQAIAHVHAKLAYEGELLILMNPVGAEGNRFVLFRKPENNALVLLTFEKLFDNGGEGAFHGIVVNDVFVVKTAVPVSEKAAERLHRAQQACSGKVEWTSVPRPREGGTICSGWKLVSAWLKNAKQLAKIPTKDVFYHVGSAESMKTEMGYTGP